jgi:hypothetical protein
MASIAPRKESVIAWKVTVKDAYRHPAFKVAFRVFSGGEPEGSVPPGCGDYDLGLIRFLRFFCAFLGFGDAVRMGTDTRQLATVHY